MIQWTFLLERVFQKSSKRVFACSLNWTAPTNTQLVFKASPSISPNSFVVFSVSMPCTL
jgi:hypothetical protein